MIFAKNLYRACVQTAFASIARVDAYLKPARIRAVTVIWSVIAFVGYIVRQTQEASVGLTDGHGQPLGNDFINYWSAAKLAWLGRAPEIYDWEKFHAFEQAITRAPMDFYHYSYPPVLPLLTFPLVFLPYIAAMGVWLVATWGLFYKALRIVDPRKALALSLCMPAVFYNAVSCQNGMLTAALLGGGLALLPRRPLYAGLLFGLLVFKPQIGLLLPAALIAGRYWKTLGVAALTALALISVSLLLYGVGVWQAYFDNARILRHFVLETDATHTWHRYVTVFIAARQLGAGITTAYIIQGLAALGVVVALIELWRRAAPHPVRAAALIVGTFLVTPYALDYDLVVTAFAAVWMIQAYPHTRFAAALLVVTPVFSTFTGGIAGIVIAPLLMLPAFLTCVLDPYAWGTGRKPQCPYWRISG